MRGYGAIEMPDGSIIQGSVHSPMEGEAPDGHTMGYITRAVVLSTYYADDESWAERGEWAASLQTGIACDVRTFGRRSRPLYRVPVAQGMHGRHDEDVYVPRASKIDMQGGPLATDGAPSGPKPTQAEDLDGDHVLVGFLECDPAKPFIFPFCLSRVNANHKLEESGGRARRIRHNGVLMEWDGDGNFTIDATGAAQGDLAADGSEVSASGTAGQIILKTSDGTNQTSLHLNQSGQILLGSDPSSPSDEPMVLGTQWINIMGELIAAIQALTVPTGVGPSGTPLNTAAFQAVLDKINQKLHVSDFIFGRKTY